MAQIPLKDMADTGYENMPEWAGYILSEIKAFANAISPMVEDKADRSELSSIWRVAETNFAGKSDFTALTQFVSRLQEKCETIADLKQAINQLASADTSTQIADLKQSVNYLATHTDHSKCYVADITISTEEMLALNATPKTLISAPGAGKYIEVNRVEFFLDFETAAYASLQDLSLEYATSGQLQLIPTAGWLDGTSDERRCAHHTDLHLVGVDEAVTLNMLVGEILTGDSPLKVRVDYRIVETLK